MYSNSLTYFRNIHSMHLNICQHCYVLCAYTGIWSCFGLQLLITPLVSLNCSNNWCSIFTESMYPNRVLYISNATHYFDSVYCDRHIKGGAVLVVIVYSSWIYNYLCNQCISPLLLWHQIAQARCTRYNIVIKLVSDLLQVGGFLQ